MREEVKPAVRWWCGEKRGERTINLEEGWGMGVGLITAALPAAVPLRRNLLLLSRLCLGEDTRERESESIGFFWVLGGALGAGPCFHFSQIPPR